MTTIIHPFYLLVIALAGLLNRHQQAVIDYLIEENRVLKDQLEGRWLRFTDKLFDLCCVRVPTWAAFRLQVYFNGHDWLAQRLRKVGIAFEMADNAFLSIADPDRAQALAKRFDAKQLHRRLDKWARQFCPVHRRFRSGYHWSLMQVEFAVLFLRTFWTFPFEFSTRATESGVYPWGPADQ